MAKFADGNSGQESAGAACRRREPRIPVAFTARLLRRGAKLYSTPAPGSACNLSMGGIFIKSDEALTAGEQVELALDIPGAENPITAIGIVRWCQNGSPGGAGIEFIQAAPGDEGRLESLLQERYDESIKELKPGRGRG